MMMLQLETQENTIGKMPAVIFKLLAVIGVHKSIFKKLPIKVVLIHINKNKIKWPLKYYLKLIIVIMLHYKEQILIWITCMPNLIQEEQSWKVNKKNKQKRTYNPNPDVDPSQNTLIAKAVIDKHGFNNANLDTHDYAPQPAPVIVNDYEQKTSANIPAKTPHQQKKLAMLTSTIGGHDAIKQYDN